ncbi:trihydrophobin-like [Selaginella moellendorffii]|uniref:trihydrophobin-like n=1 Tax=Selaginella moellendorffii TaxID=88036 RepID=UPI000D1C6A7B|nr:trihydrophobin-like [Selaginella moellendorffii]|eukprot:XP_024532111.1 trihydrophobin-like [Selaginella moellendorffii]
MCSSNSTSLSASATPLVEALSDLAPTSGPTPPSNVLGHCSVFAIFYEYVKSSGICGCGSNGSDDNGCNGDVGGDDGGNGSGNGNDGGGNNGGEDGGGNSSDEGRGGNGGEGDGNSNDGGGINGSGGKNGGAYGLELFGCEDAHTECPAECLAQALGTGEVGRASLPVYRPAPKHHGRPAQ